MVSKKEYKRLRKGNIDTDTVGQSAVDKLATESL
jgi:hypothetical protein